MQIVGLDGMRYLGSHPGEPADDIERAVMTMLANKIQDEMNA